MKQSTVITLCVSVAAFYVGVKIGVAGTLEDQKTKNKNLLVENDYLRVAALAGQELYVNLFREVNTDQAMARYKDQMDFYRVILNAVDS